MNILLLQTGIFLSSPSLEISYQPSTYLTGEFRLKRKPSVPTCGIQEMENVFCVGKKWRSKENPDMYEHLFKCHIKNFIKCMILSDALVDHVMEDDIRYVKEEVKAVASITNCMGFGRSVLTDRIMYMVKRKARDIVENRLDSKVFANVDVLNSFIGKVENYLQELIVPF